MGALGLGMGDEHQHVDESEAYSQVFGIAIGHPPESELFREVDDGYVLDATPNDEIRELIEQMRTDQEEQSKRSNPFTAHKLKYWADELEALIEENDEN